MGIEYVLSPFTAACGHGHTSVLDWLVGHDVPASDMTAAGSSIRYMSILYIWTLSFIRLLGDDGITPFIAACAGGHTHVLDWLVSHGMPLSEITRSGMSVCMYFF